MTSLMKAGCTGVTGICGQPSTSGKAYTTYHRTALAAVCRRSDLPRPPRLVVAPGADFALSWCQLSSPPCGSTVLVYSSSPSRSSSVRRQCTVPPAPLKLGEEDEDEDEDDEDGEDEDEDGEDVENRVKDNADYRENIVPTRLRFEPLGPKERKELRAYAHGLGTRLDVHQVGKRGVIQTVVNSISDSLEANEILKVKVLENSPSDISDVVAQLEWGTGGQVVGKIGRTLLLYRASLRKLAAASEQQRPESRVKRWSKSATSSRPKRKNKQRVKR